jgi:hypothetical protein
VGLPLAALGTVAWYLPFKSPRVTLGLYRPVYEAVASLKLATALIAFPAMYAVWLAAAWLVAGLIGTLATALVLPAVGIVALRWRDRWGRVREDARIFWRALRGRELRDQLVERRRALVEEFDAVARRWQAEERDRQREPL